MYVRTYVRIYIYIYMYILVCIYMYVCICVYICIWHVCIFLTADALIAYTHRYIHRYIHIYIHACVCTCIHKFSPLVPLIVLRHTYACMCIYIHKYIHLHIHTYKYTHTYVCTISHRLCPWLRFSFANSLKMSCTSHTAFPYTYMYFKNISARANAKNGQVYNWSGQKLIKGVKFAHHECRHALWVRGKACVQMDTYVYLQIRYPIIHTCIRTYIDIHT
jgi:hypothetical protein